MNPQTACRPITALLTRMSIHSANCQEKSVTSRFGKRLLSRVTIYKRERRFSRSETGFSLPNERGSGSEYIDSVGKLFGDIEPKFGNRSLASGAVIGAQHLYVKSDAPRLDQESMESWERSEAAGRLRESILWLINHANSPLISSDVPATWWRLALELRATSTEEPETFAFAYFVWSVMAEEGSTIEGI